MTTPVSQLAAGAVMPLSGMTPPRQCVREIIMRRLHTMQAHESGTRQDTDVEALHDMRVASRRLREAFEIFAFCFPAKSYQKLYRRVRRVTSSLGEMRNADVALAYFSGLSKKTDDILIHVALEEVLRRLARDRRKARARLLRGLDQSQLDNFPNELDSVFQRIENMPQRYQRGPRQSVTLARRLLSQRLRELFAARTAVAGEHDEANLHKVRIAIKKLRYAIETLDYAVGEKVVGNLKELRHLQNLLGELHDRDVFAALVHKRLGKLQGQPHSILLCNGLQAVLNMIANERHEYYLQYVNLLSHDKPQEWRARFVPPVRALPPRVEAG